MKGKKVKIVRGEWQGSTRPMSRRKISWKRRKGWIFTESDLALWGSKSRNGCSDLDKMISNPESFLSSETHIFVLAQKVLFYPSPSPQPALFLSGLTGAIGKDTDVQWSARNCFSWLDGPSWKSSIWKYYETDCLWCSNWMEDIQITFD